MVYLMGLLICFFMVFIMVFIFLWSHKSSKELLQTTKEAVKSAEVAEEKRAFEEGKARVATQDSLIVLGFRLFNRLSEEVSKSQAHLLDGKPVEGLRQMAVCFNRGLNKWGEETFTVNAWIPDSREDYVPGKKWQMIDVLKADIILDKKNQLSFYATFRGDAGTNREITNFGDLEISTARYIQNYRIFYNS